MKKLLLLVLVAYGCALNSCTDQNGELVSFAQNREIASQNSMRSTRAVDSTSVDSILPIEETEESVRLRETLRQHSMQSVSTLASYGEDDEYFSSNIYAIREMPLNISVRLVQLVQTQAISILLAQGLERKFRSLVRIQLPRVSSISKFCLHHQVYLI